MGCDIHCYIEYKSKTDSAWRDFGGRINPGRNYWMFGFMAGVCCGDLPHIEPRGAVADMAYQASGDSRLYISADYPDSEGHCSPDRAAQWVANGSSQYTDENKRWVTHPDWHSHSWLTASELEQCLQAYLAKSDNSNEANYIREYWAILAALRSFETQGLDARLVFWFDN